MFSWWQSLEVLTKLWSIVSILLICFSFILLGLKLQIDHLKRKIEKSRIAQIEDLNIKIKKAETKIKDLKIKAKKVDRGISSTYDFNGARRTTSKPGHISLEVGPEVEIFNRIQELEKQKNYSELITICEEQIKKTPEWLTPYLYLGAAYANIGKKEKAIEFFEYVVENAPEDPAYSQAKDFLKELKD